MEDFEKSLVPVYLRDWGLSEETIKNFCDNEITIDLLTEIQDNDLKELVPLIKERILFRVGVRKLEKITHETASEDTNSAPASPTTCSSHSSLCCSVKTNADPKQILNETYYIPAIVTNKKTIPARGKLVDRYNNQRRVLKKEGVLSRKRKYNDDEKQDSEVEENIIIENEELVIWLKYHKEPFQEVRENWLATRAYRVEKDYNDKTKQLQEILQKYPILKQNFGYKLIDIDFEYRYPDKEVVLFEKFDNFMEKAYTIFKNDVKSFKEYNAVFEKNPNEDTKVFIILSLLCGKLVPSVARGRAASSKKFTKPSILEARDNLVLHVKTQTDITNVLVKRREVHLEKKLTCQPIVVCVGQSVEELEAFYVNYNDVTYHMSTLLQAVDICFKIFQVFDVQYPSECLQQWMFIQHYFYKIATPHDVKFPSVCSLIADLK